MALRLSTQRRFTREVTADIPNNQGDFDHRKFKVVYEVPNTPEFADLPREEAARQAVAGWDGVEAEDGTPLPFSPENLPFVWFDLPVRRAIIEGLFAGLAGDPARKN